MKTTLALILALAVAAHAGPRTSANYAVAADTTDAGGRRATSTAYTNDGSFSAVTGLSTAAAPAQTAKHGYAGQLTDATAVQLAATPTTVNEGATRQLSATLLNDDLTTTTLLATEVSWGVQSGPLSSVSTSGLATAGIVYENTNATATALFSNLSGTLNLTVLNVNNDDIPGYHGDGLDDAWQVQYFGLGNPNAGPGVITDGTGLTNLFKFIAGLIPNNSASSFTFHPQPVPAVSGQLDLVVTPRFTDRTYTVKSTPTLGPGAVWTPLTSFTITDNGLTRTITDLDATGARKFYRVEITKP